MPILLVGKKEDQRVLSDWHRMTQLANQRKRYLGSGFPMPDLSAPSSLLYFAQKLPTGLFLLSIYTIK